MSSVFKIVGYATQESCLIVGDIYRNFSATTGTITDDLNKSTLIYKTDQANILDSSERHSDPVTGSHIGATLLMEAARQGSRQARKSLGKQVTRQGSRWGRGYLRIGIRV